MGPRFGPIGAFSIVGAAACGGLPDPDGSRQGWNERQGLVIDASGSATWERGEVGPPLDDAFAMKWSIGNFVPPGIWLLVASSQTTIAALAAHEELCDLEDANALAYSDYSLGEQFTPGRFVILFNSSIPGHVGVHIDAITPTGASPTDYLMGHPIATVDLSWYLLLDGSGDFSKLCD